MTPYDSENYFQHPLFKQANDAYSLCFLGLFLSYFTILLAVGFAIVGLNKDKERKYRSHFLYILCGCVYYTLYFAICLGVLYWTYQQHFIDQGKLWTPLFLYLFFGLSPFIWWVARFVTGWRLLQNGKDVRCPYTLWLAR